MLLATDRLVVRDLVMDDCFLVAELSRQPEVTRFQTWLRLDDEAAVRQWVAEAINHNGLVPRRAYNMAIVSRLDDRVLGWIGWGPAQDGSAWSFGFALHSAAWNRGLMTEAVEAMLAFLFGQLGVRIAEATCAESNLGSLRVLEKAGLTLTEQFSESSNGRAEPHLRYRAQAQYWQPRTGLGISLEVRPTELLGAETLAQLKELFFAAFDDRFDEEDWQHALGGQHVVVRDLSGGDVVAHAAVVERSLLVDGRPFRAGYVEAVATRPARQGQGLGRLVMSEVASMLGSSYEMGALATGVPGFYQRLGWETWTGPVFAYDRDGNHPTPDEEGAVMVLRFGSSAEVDLASAIAAPVRSGDDW